MRAQARALEGARLGSWVLELEVSILDPGGLSLGPRLWGPVFGEGANRSGPSFWLRVCLSRVWVFRVLLPCGRGFWGLGFGVWGLDFGVWRSEVWALRALELGLWEHFGLCPFERGAWCKKPGLGFGVWTLGSGGLRSRPSGLWSLGSGSALGFVLLKGGLGEKSPGLHLRARPAEKSL